MGSRRSGAAQPSTGAGAVDGSSVPAQSLSFTQRNVNAGRDIITNVNYVIPTEAGNSGGRIRAVTVSIEAVPIGTGLWTVKVNNGTSGPITDLDVDVYAGEERSLRVPVRCRPAKGNISLRDLTRDVLSETLSGGLDAIGQRAQSTYSGMPPGFGLRGQMSQLGQLGGYGSMMSSHLMNSPQMSQVIQHVQQQMLDQFPRVIPAGQSAGVLYVVDGDAEVRADIQFADEAGALWRRPFGESPEPVVEEE